MIDDRREPGRRRNGQVRVRGAQGHRAFGLEPRSTVGSIEPNQRLPLSVRLILAGVNLDDFVRFAFSRLLQGVLNIVTWIDMIRVLGKGDGAINRQNRQPHPHQNLGSKSLHPPRIIESA